MFRAGTMREEHVFSVRSNPSTDFRYTADIVIVTRV